MSEEVNEIQPGDVVALISGGPRMTVGEPIAPGIHRCYWFDELEQVHEATFPLASLFIPDPEEE